MSDRPRTVEIAEMLYGPDYKTVWTDQPPTPSDVSEWLREQRKGWSVRILDRATSINEITKWAREQGLKRMDWDFIPKKTKLPSGLANKVLSAWIGTLFQKRTYGLENQKLLCCGT